ncbi:MAG TPA: Hpt domain-containing protein, partial [Ramlibacter sp.]|nr:Hpt domain-containing protein [Ramlibacter sp.]
SALIDDSLIGELAALDEEGSPSMLGRLIRDYIGQTPAAFSAMKQHLHRRDCAELGRCAHKLGGTSASLGATAMADVCYRIERHAAEADLQSIHALVDELEMRFARTRSELLKFA